MSKKNTNVPNLKSEFKKNKRILDTYSTFKNNIIQLRNKSLLIAVSGGGDSLALCALIKYFQQENKNKIFFVLIDHKIRKNSKEEALAVKKLLKKNKISLKILNNKEKIKNNFQSKAREIRYNLLIKFCKKNNVKHILTAHHSDDQVETFLIRLSRGSGVQGLSAMKITSKLDKKIFLIRPLLDIKKKDLLYISKKIFGKIFNDPSNKNTKYLRTRVRNLKKALEKSGIHHNQIIKSIKNLASTTETLNNYIASVYKINVKTKKNLTLINFKNISFETLEIQIKILSEAIKIFSKSYYPPRSKKVINIINRLNLHKQKKFTLSGCVIKKLGNYLSIAKEA
jgi:tRNA(Ile)-lysidine synthase